MTPKTAKTRKPLVNSAIQTYKHTPKQSSI
jgi:hypothetical protein